MNIGVLKNASWIIGCKIAQSVVNLVISMISARYLGPSNYGLIGYAASVVAFAVPIMQLGFTKTIIQEFLDRPDEEGKVLGTAVVFNLITAVACIVAVYSFVAATNVGETQTLVVSILFSVSLLFQATEIIVYWFQAKLLSKYPSIVSFVSYTVVATYKVFLLITGKSVEWFAISNSIDYFLISVFLLIIYNKMGTQKLSFSFEMGKKMLSRSKYYIVSALMVTIFAQTDRIMLKAMLGEAQTGYYNAAVTCASIIGFVFVAIIDSMRPAILEAKRDGSDDYKQNLIRLYSVVTYLALLQCLIMTFFAKPIIAILFGQQYFESIPALQVVVWYTTFSYYGSIRNIWILAEGKQKYLWIINLSGALTNVLMNFWLIPIWGPVGAATASLVTQFFANVIMGYIIVPIRENNSIMIKGLNPKPTVSTLKYVFRKTLIRNT